MLNSSKFLLVTALLSTALTACDKNAPAKIDTASATATSSTATVTTTEKTSATATTADSTPISAVASVTPVVESVATPTVVASATTTTAVKETATALTPATPNLSSPSVKFPATSKSVITQAVKAGTPEATVKSMMDAMMTGTPQQVASYYGVDDPTLEPMLAEQQPMVQQQAKSLQLGTVEYNKDKTKAIMVGKLTFKDNTSKEVGYKLQKIKGEWKLMP